MQGFDLVGRGHKKGCVLHVVGGDGREAGKVGNPAMIQNLGPDSLMLKVKIIYYATNTSRRLIHCLEFLHRDNESNWGKGREDALKLI